MNWDQIRWEDTPVLFFDFETTGFSKQDRICEVALLVVHREEVIHKMHTSVNPEHPVSPGAQGVHGLSDEELSHAPRWDDVFGELRGYFMMDIPWVSHNLSFDLRMLSYNWDASTWPKDIPTLCSLTYAKKHPMLRMRPSHKLLDVANAMDVDYSLSKFHNALYDTEILSRLFPRLVGARTVGASMTRWSHEWRK